MISISANLNVMIKAAEKASKSVIRDLVRLKNYKYQKKDPMILSQKQTNM